MTNHFRAAAWLAALTIPHAFDTATAQVRVADADACVSGSALSGVVRDATGATVAGAAVVLENGVETLTSAEGRFRYGCVTAGPHRLRVVAESFAPLDLDLPAGRRLGDVAVTLRPQAVEQSVDVDGNASRGVDSTESGPSRTLQGDDLKALADDPDDLKRQLQAMTAGSGGDPELALITVDGFQSPSRLPPKSSIAFIRVNPDQFAAEYQEPPYEGGRVEVYTKPGASRVHGALFGTYGGSALNARDPFSVAKGTLGKKRFGFDLSGPVRQSGSDFAMSLEHRSIDNIAAVNAVGLDAAGNAVSITATVPRPERLWVASARLGWQLGPKNTLVASYSGTVNQRGGLGAGGTALAETAYDAQLFEHNARFINITIVSPRVVHEARASLHWEGETDTPQSTVSQVQVAGAFTGGGANIGLQRMRELGLEVYDDAIVTMAKHTVKFGVNLRVARERQSITQDTNGTYIFGGGAVAGSTETITGLEQYRRARLGLAGGTPTAYTAVTGSPQIDFAQTRASFFVQDDWKLRPNLKVSGGVRYFAQNNPTTLANLVPRVGIAWSPDKKQEWTLVAHAGMFNSKYSTEDATEIRRLDGSVRRSSIVYSPVFGSPLAGGAVPISTVRTVAPGLGTANFSEEQVGVQHASHGWSLNATYYWLRLWNEGRVRNINTPINGVRPLAPNMNVLQLQNSGKGHGSALFSSVEEHSLKPLSLFFGYIYAKIYDTGDNDTFSQPQSAYSDAGEYTLRSNQNMHNFIVNGTLHLPGKVDLSTESNIRSGRRYNVTTGFDNNNDGNFNDRPRYAATGDPNAVATQFGSLVASGGTSVFPRNAGTMPWVAFVDTNVSRSFSLTPRAAKDHAQTLSVNVRAANVLNHTNVRRVGGVLGSPLFGRAYAGDTGRRVEIGLRYSF